MASWVSAVDPGQDQLLLQLQNLTSPLPEHTWLLRSGPTKIEYSRLLVCLWWLTHQMKQFENVWNILMLYDCEWFLKYGGTSSSSFVFHGLMMTYEGLGIAWIACSFVLNDFQKRCTWSVRFPASARAHLSRFSATWKAQASAKPLSEGSLLHGTGQAELSVYLFNLL